MSLFRPYGKGSGRFQANGVSLRCAGCEHDVFEPKAFGYSGWGFVCQRCTLVHYYTKPERVGDA